MSLQAIAKPLRLEPAQLDYLAALNADELATLQQQLAVARRAQHAHVNDATRAAVNQLPRMLRKPVLKMFEGL